MISLRYLTLTMELAQTEPREETDQPSGEVLIKEQFLDTLGKLVALVELGLYGDMVGSAASDRPIKISWLVKFVQANTSVQRCWLPWEESTQLDDDKLMLEAQLERNRYIATARYFMEHNDGISAWGESLVLEHLGNCPSACHYYLCSQPTLAVKAGKGKK